MELSETLAHLGKNVTVTCVDGGRFAGLYDIYTGAADAADGEPESVSLECGGYYVEIPVAEIASIKEA